MYINIYRQYVGGDDFAPKIIVMANFGGVVLIVHIYDINSGPSSFKTLDSRAKTKFGPRAKLG